MSVDDESPDNPTNTLDQEIEQALAEADIDQSTVDDMVADARRLADGDMDDSAFREQYSELLTAIEDGEESLPDEFSSVLDTDGSDLIETIKSLDTDQDRRAVMKTMAAGGAFLGFSAWATVDDREAAPAPALGDHTRDPGDKRYGMVIDLTRCDGCLECVDACQDENNWSVGATWMYVLGFLDYEDPGRDVDFLQQGEANWSDLTEALENGEEISQENANLLVRPCQHCSDPPCTYVCPTTAAHQRDDSIVLRDYDVCIGCRYCETGCPYGVNYFQWSDPDTPEEEIRNFADHDYTSRELRNMTQEERDDILKDSGDRMHDERGRWVGSRPPKGVMGKCTFNVHRQAGNRGEAREETTACEERCAQVGRNMIMFGDLNDPESKPNQYLEWRRQIAAEEHQPAEEFMGGEGFDEWRDTDMEDWPNREDDTDYDDRHSRLPPGGGGLEAVNEGRPPGRISEFRLLEDMGTDPNIIYIGNEPGPNDKEIPGGWDDVDVDYDVYEHGGSYDTMVGGRNRAVEDTEERTLRFGDLAGGGGGGDE